MSLTVFKIQHFCTSDGPGIRTTVFFKGCPLRCIWCHNPEGLSPKPDLGFLEQKCVSCRRCTYTCPNGTHSFNPKHEIDRTKCTSCGKCVKACPNGALELHGIQMTEDEIIDDVCLDSLFYGEDGGVTLSGGEPFAQGERLIPLLRKMKEHGLNICIETCGYTSPELLKKAAEYTDIFLYDLKETNEENHIRFTGAGRRRIMENLALLDSIGARVILRCPIIPGCNDRDEHYEAIADIACSHGCIEKIELEPYHPLGLGKSEQLGIIPKHTDPNFLSASSLRGAYEMIRARGMRVTVNGNEI